LICAIALSLAYPVREYIAQRQQVDQLLAQQQTLSAQVQALQQQDTKLTQTWYIEQRARAQLHMCFPDEQCYEVISGQPPRSPASSKQAASATPGTTNCCSRSSTRTPSHANDTAKAHDTAKPMINPKDAAAVAAQLGRAPRGLRSVAHRCPCGLPDVVETAPRLAGRHPVPDAVLPDLPARRGRVSGLEAAGLMRRR